MDLKAVGCKTNTGTGAFGQFDMNTRFCTAGLFNAEFLEICELAWSNRSFPGVFSAVVFDWSHHIAKRSCNEGIDVEEGVVPWNRNIPKTTNFMK